MRSISLIFIASCLTFLTAFKQNNEISLHYTPEYVTPIIPNTYNNQQPKVVKPQASFAPIIPMKMTTVIDLKIIAIIESGNDKNAHNVTYSAKGKFQLREDAWYDACKKLGVKYDFNNWSDIRAHCKELADCYFHECIPAMLKSVKVPVTTETTIGCYNWGITNVARAYKRYGKNWATRLPQETKTYINSYKNIAAQ